jgi:hypothetical protein
MRYHVTLSNNQEFLTDFKLGVSPSTPGGTVLSHHFGNTFICQDRDRYTGQARGVPHHRVLNPAHVITILDRDCG